MRSFLAACSCLILCSCGNRDHWSHQKIHSNYEQFSYSKVIYQARDPVRGVDVEFVQSQENLKTYLLVHSIPILASKDTPKKIKVKMHIDDVFLTCEADRLDGGQRFLLPETITLTLIEAFLAKKNVTITIPGYRSSIDSEGFIKHFRKIGRSFLENPFHLPF